MNNEKIQKFLDAWHQSVEAKDLKLMESFIAEDVTLISPALFHPKEGKKGVISLLCDVVASIDHYKITKTWIQGNEILLEFDAVVKDRKIQGIDKITLNEDGEMKQLKVFIRPYSGLKALIASIVQLTLSREEDKMSWSQKILARTAFTLKSKWAALKNE